MTTVYTTGLGESQREWVPLSEYDALAAEHKRIGIAQCQAEARYLTRIRKLESALGKMIGAYPDWENNEQCAAVQEAEACFAQQNK